MRAIDLSVLFTLFKKRVAFCNYSATFVYFHCLPHSLDSNGQGRFITCYYWNQAASKCSLLEQKGETEKQEVIEGKTTCSALVGDS